MKFVLNRNYVLASVMGHSIRFEKGVPTHVPSECHREAVAIGAISEEEIEMEDKKPEDVQEPTDPEVRRKAVFGAFEQLVLRNSRDDFTAGGAPHGKAIKAILGWALNNRDRDALWQEFQTAEKAEK